MSLTLKKLCSENNNQFRLTLCAGQDGYHNAVTWVYMLEDDYIIPYFHNSELVVTTGIKTVQDPSWLMTLVFKLVNQHVAGLIINVGKFIEDIPQDVLDYCNEHDFPLLTMPWKIHMTDMIQNFCMRIIRERYDSSIHDQALNDAISGRDNEAEYREILSRYYDLESKFTVILVYINRPGDNIRQMEEMDYLFINRIRHFKATHGLKTSKFGLVSHENYELMITNNVDQSCFPDLIRIITDVYSDAVKQKALFIGIGTEVSDISQISKSYNRAYTAMRMAIYRNTPYISFEDMGFYKILFSVKDEEVLYSYADEILAPLEAAEGKAQSYLELLKAYIENDRSLERTAAALYLHRNTVNYRLQKLKELLNSPLKTVNDLFPYQVALAIRDMEMKSIALIHNQ